VCKVCEEDTIPWSAMCSECVRERQNTEVFFVSQERMVVFLGWLF
jgi:hypothetical protein